MASIPWLPEHGFPSKTQQEDEEDEQSYRRHGDLAATLPEDNRWIPLRRFQGFWMFNTILPATLAAREHFVARPSDIFLSSIPKSGTTWLKSMVFSIVYRGRYPPRDEMHPMRRANPHDLVPFVEHLYLWWKNPNLSELPSPRIFATHTPYSVLLESIKSSGSRIIHVARDPKDNFVSFWHFSTALATKEGPSGRVIPMDEAFDMFCSGISFNGPIWEHILEYWNEHLKRPDKVLFLKYEDMKKNPVRSLKNVAVFLGCPFSADEEKQGVPKDISELCSFKTLSNLEVNKDGILERSVLTVPKKLFFRRGEAGDWANHLTPEMAEKLDRITHDKLQGSSLNF